ncbi:MAG: hypothetical protein JNL70_10825 [Saprospiraceae bacterium]|nr:hypothetical protein [Saprospiraceae bacterium]
MKKHFLITIFSIFACLAIGKSQKVETFSVTFKPIFSDSIRYSKDKTFRYHDNKADKELCILKDNIEIPLSFLKINKVNKVKYSGLTKGNYTVRYENVFAQIVDKPFTITNKSIKNVPIGLDEFIDTVKISFFKEMKNGDSLGIYFSQQWHEGYNSDSIEITKNNDIFKAKLFKFSYDNHIINVISVIKEKTLSANDIALMENLFKRLTMLRRTWEHAGSPPERTYRITINRKLICQFFNDHPDWNSFDLLKDKVFIVEPDKHYYKFINH